MTDSGGTALGSMLYAPFGSTRSGSVPTDIKFTGQILDNTGLYYYGARYYDPAIGRFISADPIVQSYANPQSLNRYSYVWNNPLKHTDPSGLIVEFENEDYILAMLGELAMYGMDYASGSSFDQMVQDWAELRLAWDELAAVAPELTDFLAREDTPITVIRWDLGLPLEVGGAARPGENTILLNPANLHRKDSRETVVTLAHEGFHRAVDIIYGSHTLEEEAIAFSLGFAAGRRLGYVSPSSAIVPSVFPGRYEGFEEQVNVAGGVLVTKSNHYAHAPLAGMGSSLSLGNLYGLARWFWPGIRW
jgi:RHS repeat-associated protein